MSASNVWFVALRTDLLIDFAHHTVRADHDGSAIPVHCSLVIRLPNAARLQKFRIRVGEQINCEGKLIAEVLMRSDVVLTHAVPTPASSKSLLLAVKDCPWIVQPGVSSLG